MRNKKFLTVLCSVLLLSQITVETYAAPAGNRYDSYISGSGKTATEMENYQVIAISDEEDLKKLADQCELADWSCDKLIQLKNDIELSRYSNLTIPSFSGIFEGNGHCISSLKIMDAGSSLGFFRYIRENGEVKNLKVKGSIIPSGSRGSLGGIAGENYGHIFYCDFEGTVEGDSRIGGIAGINGENGEITGCRNMGVVIGNHSTGGITGENHGTLKSCKNTGDINICSREVAYSLDDFDMEELEQINDTENLSTHTDSGGIAGLSDGKIYYCINNGTVGYSHVGYNTGGIAGRLKQGYIQNCSNTGQIYGRKDVGGIAGQMEPFLEISYFKDQLQLLDGEVNYFFDLLDQTRNSAGEYGKQFTDVSRLVTEDLKNVSRAGQQINSAGVELWNVYNSELDAFGNDIRNKDYNLDVGMPEIEFTAAVSEKDGGSGGPAEENGEDGPADGSGEDGPAEGNGKDGPAEGKGDDGTGDGGTGDGGTESEGGGSSSGDGSGNSGSGESGNKLPDIHINMDDIKNSLDHAQEELENSKNQAADRIQHMTEASGAQGEVIRGGMEQMNQSMLSAGEHLQQMVDILAGAGSEADVHADALVAQAKVIRNRIDGIRNDLFCYEGITVEDSSDEQGTKGEIDPGVNDEEITEETQQYYDTDSFQLGKITLCVNQGSVTADTNVGGIAGQVATEYDFDPEDDITSTGEKSMNVEQSMKAVIRDSRNLGTVSGKKDCVGGIAGKAENGAMISCESYGAVGSSNGDYVGGIAGICDNIIRSCYTMGDISGRNCVGGIAGKACHIYGSYAYNDVDYSGESAGSIAGTMKKDGILSGNYYVEGRMGAVDGVSFADGAEPLPYEEFCSREEVPEAFSSFEITFLLDGKELASYRRGYGDKITPDLIPDIPEKEGCYAYWPDYDFDFIKGNKILEAQYEKWTPALENDSYHILVEGQFYPGMELQVTEDGETVNLTVKDPESGEIYDGELTVHVPCENAENASVLTESGGTFVETECSKKGSCLIFHMDRPGSYQLALHEEGISAVWWVVTGLAAAAAVLIFILVMKKKKLFQKWKRKKKVKKELKEEKQKKKKKQD